MNKRILLKGLSASPGLISGKARIVKNVKDMKRVKNGDIVVCPFLLPDFTVFLNKKLSLGIITDQGGITCHAAILAREFNIPYLAGTKIATKKIKENSEIILDAENGVVYEIV